MSYSKTMDALLLHVHRTGEIPKKIAGTTVKKSTVEGLMTRGAVEQDSSGKPVITNSGRHYIKTALGENVDRPRQSRFVAPHRSDWVVTYDTGQADYEYWDEARRGEKSGLEIAGMFLKPLYSKKAAWVLGEMPQLLYDDPYTQEEMNKWLRDYHADILLAYEESAALGDHYIVVNPDESVTLVAPHVVEPMVDENDYSKHIGYSIQQTYQHPSYAMKRQTIKDDFTAKGHTRSVSQGGRDGKAVSYRLSLPFAPVVHIPNNQRANEIYGHPEGEALLHLLFNYNEIFCAAIEGNLKQGRPVAVFEEMGTADHLRAFLDEFAIAETQIMPNGDERTYYSVDWAGVVALGENAKFNWKSPGQFMGDTEKILGLLFYLIVQHSEMPEFIFGNAIQGSKASAETQLPPFVKWAQKEQGRAEKWIIRMVQIVAALKALVDPKIKASEKPSVKWMPLTQSDGKLTLEAIKVAVTVGGWAAEDLVPFYPLDIDDEQAIIDKIVAMKEESRRQANGEDEPFIRDDNQDDDSPTDEPANTEDEPAPEAETWKRQLAEAAHTGAMIAFEIPLDIATNLALAAKQSGLEALAPEDMHITLAFMGDVSQLEDKREAIESAMQSFGSTTYCLEGVIGGIGRFNASNTSDGMDVIYASFDSAALTEFRQALVEAIESTGVEISRAHGFTPHITLAYVEKGSVMPNLALETMALKFDKIVLAWGDERKAFNLKQKDIELVAELA
jgi:2'-5' RNA ligase